MAENFSTWQKKQTYKSSKSRVPNKMNPKRPTSRYITIKMQKMKDRILKVAREKSLVTYERAPITMSSDFSTETLKARRN